MSLRPLTILLCLLSFVCVSPAKGNGEALKKFKAAYIHDQTAAVIMRYGLLIGQVIEDVERTKSTDSVSKIFETEHLYQKINSPESLMKFGAYLLEVQEHLRDLSPDANDTFVIDTLQSFDTCLMTNILIPESKLARDGYIEADALQQSEDTKILEISQFALFAKKYIHPTGNFVDKQLVQDPLSFIPPAVMADTGTEHVAQDPTLAFFWYYRVSKHANPHALTEVAYRLVMGEGVEKEPITGLRCLTLLYPPENCLPQWFPNFLERELGKTWAFRTSLMTTIVALDLLLENCASCHNVLIPFVYMAATYGLETYFKTYKTHTPQEIQLLLKGGEDFRTIMGAYCPTITLENLALWRPSVRKHRKNELLLLTSQNQSHA